MYQRVTRIVADVKNLPGERIDAPLRDEPDRRRNPDVLVPRHTLQANVLHILCDEPGERLLSRRRLDEQRFPRPLERGENALERPYLNIAVERVSKRERIGVGRRQVTSNGPKRCLNEGNTPYCDGVAINHDSPTVHLRQRCELNLTAGLLGDIAYELLFPLQSVPQTGAR